MERNLTVWRKIAKQSNPKVIQQIRKKDEKRRNIEEEEKREKKGKEKATEEKRKERCGESFSGSIYLILLPVPIM